MACCNDNEVVIKEARIEDAREWFDIQAMQKRITSIERRVTDLEYKLLEMGKGATR